MKRTLAALVIAAPILVEAMFGQDALKLQVKTRTTQTVAFAAGGTIHINGSYGYLSVEGWDRPEVEISVTKSRVSFGDAATQADDEKRVESIHVEMKAGSPTDLTIQTTLASRHGTWAPPLPANTSNGVTAQYEVHVPRDSRLIIHHGVGYVQVGSVTGDIEATGHHGDIVVMLPESGAYSIDAKSKFGAVLSDVAGKVRVRRFIGETFAAPAPSPSRRVYLRMGFGGITIKRVPIEGY